MSHKNQIPWHDFRGTCKLGVKYYLAKGKGSKPKARGTCLINKAEGSGLQNSYVLEHEHFVQRPRVQSRFSVSPSPRKVPRYKLIDEETAQQPFNMVRNF